MGGRGASSGTSHYERKDGTVVENPYGSQYHALMTVGNIKFVSKNSRQYEPLIETMTRGRVYAHVEGADLKSIVYFDSSGKRSKQIDLSHKHKGKSPHTHYGYEFPKGIHDANGLTPKEKAMVDRVINLWNNRDGR